MTVRFRLLVVTILGLAATMALWGWSQIRALDGILINQQLKRLYDVAETVNTYYQHFPTVQGLSALDEALKDHVQSDGRLARIDIFSTSGSDADYIAGAGRVSYEWPEAQVTAAAEKGRPFYVKITTDGGPGLGLLYPAKWGETPGRRVVISAVAFSRANTEILARARKLLIVSSLGLLIAIMAILALSYRLLIEKPLKIIIGTIDEFHAGKYAGRIPLTRKDEWGRLADHFNVMAGEIEGVLERNRELNLRLEERVQEATHKVVQLQKQVDQLQQLTALGYLTATLAHDLGTPLHSIAGLARLLLEEDRGLSPEAAHKLELIVQQTDRLHAVIENLRRATRLPGPHFSFLSLSELIRETLALVEPQLRLSRIGFTLNLEPDLPPLYADRDRLQTALFNIIQNAVEAMPEGGEVSLSARADAARRAVALSVKDTGVGIAPEDLDHVCEPFFSTHEEEGMRGLGLSIVHDIVKAHGGRMEIKSGDGGGSEIILHFPTADKPPV